MIFYRLYKMFGQAGRWAIFLLLPVFLSSCTATGSFDSISDVYSRAQKQLFPHQQATDPAEAEDPVVSELRRKLEESEREKELLSNDIKTLERELQKKELAILLQGKVIKLLDDSDHTLQKNIEEQIAAQSFDSDAATVSLEP